MKLWTLKQKLLLTIAALHLSLAGLGAASVSYWGLGRVGKALSWYSLVSGASGTYGFFAPDIGNSLRAQFDIYDPKGRLITTESLENATNREANLRIYNILETLDGELDDPVSRHLLSGAWVGKVFSRHPEASRIVLRVESIDVSSMPEYRRGKRKNWARFTGRNSPANRGSLVGSRLHRFLFDPASPAPLAALRIGVALTLLVQALYCAGTYFEWYGTDGLLQGGLSERFAWGIPQTSALIRAFAHIGISEHVTLWLIGGLYLFGLLSLLVGWHTRIAAFVTWALHIVLTQQHVTSYGADILSHVFLFYLVWMPCGHGWSLDRWVGRVSGAKSSGARFGLRVCQLQLCLVYFASGFEKATGPQWWNGEAIWRSVMLPVYRQYDFGWLASVPWLPVLLGWATLLVEMGYPFLIFPRRSRRLWLLATVGMHVGISLFLGLHLFALLMAVLSIAVFGVESDPLPARTMPSEERYPPQAASQLAPLDRLVM